MSVCLYEYCELILDWLSCDCVRSSCKSKYEDYYCSYEDLLDSRDETGEYKPPVVPVYKPEFEKEEEL